jgi:hypothetical protein
MNNSKMKGFTANKMFTQHCLDFHKNLITLIVAFGLFGPSQGGLTKWLTLVTALACAIYAGNKARMLLDWIEYEENKVLEKS